MAAVVDVINPAAAAEMEVAVDRQAINNADSAVAVDKETTPSLMDIPLVTEADDMVLVPLMSLMLTFGGKSGPTHYRACETKGNQKVAVQQRGRTKYVSLLDVPSFLLGIYPNRDLTEPTMGLPAFLETKGNMEPEKVQELLEKAKNQVTTTKETKDEENAVAANKDSEMQGATKPKPKAKSAGKPRGAKSKIEVDVGPNSQTATNTKQSARSATSRAKDPNGKRKEPSDTLTDLLTAQVCEVVEEFKNKNGLTQEDVVEVARMVIGMPTTKRTKSAQTSNPLEETSSKIPQDPMVKNTKGSDEVVTETLEGVVGGNDDMEA